MAEQPPLSHCNRDPVLPIEWLKGLDGEVRYVTRPSAGIETGQQEKNDS